MHSLKALKNKKIKILVIGDLMLDHYIYGNCTRISPEAPVPVVEFVNEVYTLGGAGNVLKNLFSLGVLADLVSVTGNDENANFILKELSIYPLLGEGIIKDETRCTTVKTRVLVTNHQLIRLDYEEKKEISALVQDAILRYFKKIICDQDIVLISDYSKGVLTPTLLNEVFTLCSKKGIKTIVDPKGTDFSKYKGADFIKPNKKEAAQATNIAITDDESLKKACMSIQEITGCSDVAITMSENGIAHYSNEMLSIIPTRAFAVVDVTGAGDTVLAALAVSIASGNSAIQACEFANQAAAVVVNKIGSATVTIDEINNKI